jgi:glycosyltransferase involved in cell wall biosynthesis
MACQFARLDRTIPRLMKTLHIFHNSDLLNGVDLTTLTLIRSLARLGVDPQALVPRHGQVTDVLAAEGFKFKVSNLQCCTGPSVSAELRYMAQLHERAVMLEEWLREETFDLVHMNTGHLLDCAIASALTGTPAVWHIHSPFEVDYARYHRIMPASGYAWVLRSFGCHILAVSDDVSRSLSEYVPSKKISTLFNGIDIDDLDKRAAAPNKGIKSELGIDAGAPLVLGVGRISAQKDFSAFVRVADLVCKGHPNVCFAIAGPAEDQKLADSLLVQIEQLGLQRRVFVLGPRNDVPSLISQADIFLSTAVFEGQGLAALEAMSLRRPVVAMACIGLRECITHRHDGLLVPPGDESKCAELIAEVLISPSLAWQLGEQGRLTVAARFSSNTYAESFLAIVKHNCERLPPTEVGAATFALGLLKEVREGYERLLKAHASPQHFGKHAQQVLARLLPGLGNR